MVERWPFKPMVVGSIPTEGVTLLVGVVGNISACHADARGSIPRRGALVPVSLVGQDIRLSGYPAFIRTTRVQVPDGEPFRSEGSKPRCASLWYHSNGGLAQSVECVVSNDEAPGSKPGFSTFAV